MKLLAAPCVDPSEFDAKGITIEFIVVKVSQDGSPVKSRQSFQVKRGELLLNPLKERTYRNLLWSIGIRLPSTARAQLIEAISRGASSLPCEADHIFVCVVALEPWYEIHFNVMTGIHVDEDKEISWDFVENPFNHVLQACKPPIPCLKKVKIQDNMGSNDALCCPICLQDFSVGSEAAATTCSHVYHSHCIVKWLLRSASCPMCRSKLPTGWFFVRGPDLNFIFIWSKLPKDEYQSNWGGLSLYNILVNIVLDSLDIFFFVLVSTSYHNDGKNLFIYCNWNTWTKVLYWLFCIKKEKEKKSEKKVKLFMNWSHGGSTVSMLY